MFFEYIFVSRSILMNKTDAREIILGLIML